MIPGEDRPLLNEQDTLRDTSRNQAGASWPPPPRNVRRRTFPTNLTILLIILIFILIMGGLGFIIYSATVQYRTTLHTQATAEALLTRTSLEKTQQVSQATANTLGTAQANIFATATAVGAATTTASTEASQATATVTALQNMLTQDTTGTPALNDPLSDKTGKGGWDQGTNSLGNTGCVFTGGDYHASEAQLGYLQPCIAEKTSFSNIVYQVQMIIDKGSQGGIIFRANSSKTRYYLFRIGADGSYALDLYSGTTQATTLNNGLSLTIATGVGQSNQVAVIANKNTLYLFINRQFITSIKDSTLSSGQIGVVALDYSTPTEVEFSNAQVWQL